MPLARKRTYIRLAEGLSQSEKKDIPSVAIDRTLNVLKKFSGTLKRFRVHSVNAVVTGVIREAPNRDKFLDRIYEETGIRVRVITGVEEAYLTAKGALQALNIHTDPFAVFDLGGGSTEFFIGSEDTRLRLPGLDKGRADVILAGCLTVIRILYFFKSLQLKVSMSDLLEGILVEKLEGERNE